MLFASLFLQILCYNIRATQGPAKAKRKQTFKKRNQPRLTHQRIVVSNALKVLHISNDFFATKLKRVAPF